MDRESHATCQRRIAGTGGTPLLARRHRRPRQRGPRNLGDLTLRNLSGRPPDARRSPGILRGVPPSRQHRPRMESHARGLGLPTLPIDPQWRTRLAPATLRHQRPGRPHLLGYPGNGRRIPLRHRFPPHRQWHHRRWNDVVTTSLGHRRPPRPTQPARPFTRPRQQWHPLAMAGRHPSRSRHALPRLPRRQPDHLDRRSHSAHQYTHADPLPRPQSISHTPLLRSRCGGCRRQ